MVQDPRPPIGLYTEAPAGCQEYDPQFSRVAEFVAGLIVAAAPHVRVEHVGSTSVPHCLGKGIVDLLVLYPPGEIEPVRQALASLGFQRQSTRDPFPEDRPMRTGAVDWRGKQYRLHVHVVEENSAEVRELLAFRDRLRADPVLREAYVARKLEILRSGVTDSLDYCLAKGSFVEDCLRSMR